ATAPSFPHRGPSDRTQNLTIRVTDANGRQDTVQWTVEVQSPIAIVGGAFPDAYIGKSFNHAFQGEGGSNYAWSASGLPSGLSVRSEEHTSELHSREH